MRQESLWLAGILVLALAIRAFVLIALPNIHAPDEIFQTLEQAHRAVFGYGVVPWEYQLGIRSWILPGLLAGPLWLGGALSDGPEVYLLLAGGCLVLLSLLIVVGAFVLGRWISLTHAVTAGFAAAIWFELVYHAGRSLTEVVATVPLILALVLASKPVPRRVGLVSIGLLLGLCLALRFHLAPGVAVVVLYLVWRQGWRVLTPLGLGGLLPLVAVGAIDAWTWGVPFASIIRNFGVNVVEGRADFFGVAPFYQYVLYVGSRWLVAMPVLLLLAALGARRYPLWLATAAAIIVSHSLIGHKEYRFIFPAITCLVILAGIGSGEVVVWLRRGVSGRRWGRFALSGCLAIWALASLALSFGPYQVNAWSAGRSQMQALHWLHGQQDLCGLASSGLGIGRGGGYAHLHRDVPFLLGSSEQLRASHTEAFNYLIHRTSADEPPITGYGRETCFADSLLGEICVYRRAGTCNQPGDG